MTDITTFPTIKNVVEFGDNILPLVAGEAITAGQAVGPAATGVSGSVVAMDATSGEWPIGVAVFTAASGAPISVASIGCVVYVANADDTTGIDAGDWVECNDNAVKGTVSTVVVAATGGATATLHLGVLGRAIDDIAGGGTGRIIVLPVPLTQANTS